MNARRLLAMLWVNLRLCMVEIFSNKVRSFISSLGIFLGATSLLVNMAFMRAMQDNIAQNMDQMGGATILTVREREPQDEGELLEFHRSPGLRYSEVKQIADSINGVEGVITQRDMGWRTYRAQGDHTHGNLKAIGSDFHALYNYEIGPGRTFTREEYEGRSLVCIIGTRLGERLFGDDERLVGRTIIVDRIPHEVIGVIKTASRWDRRSRECHVPYKLCARTIGIPDRVGEVSVKVTGISVVERVRVELERAVRRSHRGVTDFEVEANLDKIKDMQNASMGIRVVIGAIAFISLCVGAVSVMNTMFGTIGDRIREIGVRKALGARQSDLFTQFLLEAVLLSFVGGVPGLLVGTAFTLFPEGTFPFTPRIDTFDYAISAAFITVAGVASGVFPALHAARMEPVEALRY
ncbi:MAG: FtsX-like permease family protein [Chitinivibrionales bacterium]|nr:FtsX-like permease family protein [Chitinivibrionales bacterium]